MNSIFLFIKIFIVALLLNACNNDNNKKTEPTETASAAKEKGATAMKTKTILFFGNSLTAAYGLDDPAKGFAGLTQKRIDSLRLGYKVINGGVSGETSSGGNSRVDWILKQPVDVFVLELGGNDGLRGIPVKETKKNLQAILNKVKAKYPDAKLVLAGMQMPPSMGKQYTTDFKNVYTDLAKTNNLILIPFLLQGVGGEAKFNQQDGIHPTVEGHRMIAETVWKYLEPIL
jgi:acyl-CoA thioesterase-1